MIFNYYFFIIKKRSGIILQEKEKVMITDLNGIEKEYVVLSSFESEKTKHKYVICLDDSHSIDDEIALIPLIYNEDEASFWFVEDDTDMEEIERVINDLVELKNLAGMGDDNE